MRSESLQLSWFEFYRFDFRVLDPVLDTNQQRVFFTSESRVQRMDSYMETFALH